MSIAFEGPGGWIHGRAVSPNGEVKYLSASAMNKAKLCLRRYIYDYVHGIKDPAGEAAIVGKALHAETANYLTTGSRAGLSSQVLAGLHMIEPPGPDLLVEHDLLLRPGPKPEFTAENSDMLLAQAPVRAAGIPLTGAIDLMHARGTNRGTSDVRETHDPPGTVEICDHKFPRRLDRAKTPDELLTDLQMSSYGKYVFAVVPAANLVRLSHLYMPQRGTPRKVTVLATREQIDASWEDAEHLAGLIRDAAREPDIDQVDANTNSCRAYNRDCPARSVCSAGMHNSLQNIFGVSGARGLLQENRMSTDNAQAPVIAPNSLLAKLTAARAAQPQPKAHPADVTAEMLRLARQEAEAKYPGLATTIAEIEALGLGFVTLAGEAARTLAALRGHSLAGDKINGSGELASVVIEDPKVIFQLLTEAKEIAASRGAKATAPAMPVIVPPEAPPPVPIVREVSMPSTPPPAPQTDAAAVAAVAAAAEAPKKRGRPKSAAKAIIDTTAVEKPATAATPAPVTDSTAPATATTVESEPSEAAETSSAINLYVDCVVDGIQTQSLWPIIDEMMDKLAERAGAMTKLGDGRVLITDVRLADPNGPVGFGRWKAALKAFLRECPIPPGNYVFDGSYGEVGGAVVEAMRDIVRKSGGTFVRGAR